MSKMKKIITIFLVAIASFAFGIITFAAETPTTGSTKAVNDRNSGEIVSPAMMRGLAEIKLGETRTVGYLNGEPLNITLVSEKMDDMARGSNKTASKTFYVTYLNKNAISINLKASYYADGIDGLSNYMVDMTGKYTILKDSFSAVWGESEANDTYIGMTLNVSHFSGDAEIRFESWIKLTISGGVTFYMS